MGSIWQDAFPYVAALLPTAGTVFLFYFVMKYIFEGDRRERVAQAQWEAEHSRPQSASPLPAPSEPADLSGAHGDVPDGTGERADHPPG